MEPGTGPHTGHRLWLFTGETSLWWNSPGRSNLDCEWQLENSEDLSSFPPLPALVGHSSHPALMRVLAKAANTDILIFQSYFLYSFLTDNWYISHIIEGLDSIKCCVTAVTYGRTLAFPACPLPGSSASACTFRPCFRGCAQARRLSAPHLGARV